MVRVVLAVQVRQFPEEVEQLIGVCHRPFVEKWEVVLQIATPAQQVEAINPGKVLDPAIRWKSLQVHQRGTPLVARMPIQVDDLRPRKMTAMPGEAKVDAVALQDRPALRSHQQNARVGERSEE